MATRSVKVSNISLSASEQDLKEFLTFPGKIDHIEMQSEDEKSVVAYVTFSNPEGAETAVLLSGAVLDGQPMTIALAPDYVSPASAASTTQNPTEPTVIKTAESVVASMLAKGYILGQDVLNRAKALDEKHQITSTAASKVVSLDQKVGLTEKISAGAILVNDKVKEMDEKFQVSDKAKSAVSAAEQSISNAGSAIMNNRHVLVGASWVLGAYNKVAKAAEEVGQKTKEVVLAQDDNQGKIETEGNVHTIMPEHAVTTANQPPEYATITTNQPLEHASATANQPPEIAATTANQPSGPNQDTTAVHPPNNPATGKA